MNTNRIVVDCLISQGHHTWFVSLASIAAFNARCFYALCSNGLPQCLTVHNEYEICCADPKFFSCTFLLAMYLLYSKNCRLSTVFWTVLSKMLKLYRSFKSDTDHNSSLVCGIQRTVRYLSIEKSRFG